MMFNIFWGMDCFVVFFRGLAGENDALKRNLFWSMLLVESKLGYFLFQEVCNKDGYEKQWVKDEKRMGLEGRFDDMFYKGCHMISSKEE